LVATHTLSGTAVEHPLKIVVHELPHVVCAERARMRSERTQSTWPKSTFRQLSRLRGQE
jgi:hypothetical protein